MTIYEKLKNGIPAYQIDSHASDLYVEDTPAVREIIGDWEFIQNVEEFRSPIDNKLWLCLPFAFDPWWQERQSK